MGKKNVPLAKIASIIKLTDSKTMKTEEIAVLVGLSRNYILRVKKCADVIRSGDAVEIEKLFDENGYTYCIAPLVAEVLGYKKGNDEPKAEQMAIEEPAPSTAEIDYTDVLNRIATAIEELAKAWKGEAKC